MRTIIKALCHSIILTISFFAFVGNSQVAGAQVDPSSDHYRPLTSKLRNIENGSIIEGSSRVGGLQPDYVIDLEHPSLKAFLENARKIKERQLSFWETVHEVIQLVDKTLRYVDYKNPYYLRALKKARQSPTKTISLGEYANPTCAAGTCRERALYTHFALKEAGIPNQYSYAKIHRASHSDNYNIVEDHAFNVVKKNGRKWVVDAYYWGFNGFLLSDLLSKKGVTQKSLQAPIAEPGPGFRRIISFRNFPRIWTLKSILCQKAI